MKIMSIERSRRHSIHNLAYLITITVESLTAGLEKMSIWGSRKKREKLRKPLVWETF